MDFFYTIVLVVAVIFLILVLVVMGVMMQSQNNNTIYPPTMNRCPDYWTDDSTGCTMPLNQSNVGDYLNGTTFSTDAAPYASGNTFDPSNAAWSSSGKTAICAKRDWAIQHNIVWDGVSNYNNCTTTS
jgi:hypothetical protein